MRSLPLTALFLVVFCVGFHNAVDLQVGNSINGVLVYVENVELRAVPLTSRVKNVFYTDTSNRIIRAISALDRDQSNATVIVTAGGVGSSFANVRIKSQRGVRMFYQVQMFV